MVPVRLRQGFSFRTRSRPDQNPGQASPRRGSSLSSTDSPSCRSQESSLAEQAQDYAWQKTRPTQGRGRTDTFNPTKINVFHLPDDFTIGTVDLPAIWDQKQRVGLWLHWDGNNDQIQERNYAAAMAIGATPTSVIPSHFKAVTDFVLNLPAPKFPFPIDAANAAKGAPIFQAQCAACHAFGSIKVGTVTPIAEIATDRHRLDSFTPALVDRFHSIHEPPFVFDAYRKTDGYSNLPIDAPWARAPVPPQWLGADALGSAAARGAAPEDLLAGRERVRSGPSRLRLDRGRRQRLPARHRRSRQRQPGARVWDDAHRRAEVGADRVLEDDVRSDVWQ